MNRFIVMLLSLAFASLLILGCGGSGSSGGGMGDLQTLDVKIAGTFKGGDGKFYAESVSGGITAYGAEASDLYASADDYALTGKLTDGDVTLNLKGVYNSVTKSYDLSAASSLLRFQIKGEIDDTGAMTTGEVSVKTNNGGNWTAQTFTATVEATAPTIGAASGNVNGLPAKWLGIWRGHVYGEDFYVSVTPWALSVYWLVDGQWVQEQGDNMDIVEIDWKTPNMKCDILTLGGYPAPDYQWNKDAYVKFSVQEDSASSATIGEYGSEPGNNAFVNKSEIPSTIALSYTITR